MEFQRALLRRGAAGITAGILEKESRGAFYVYHLDLCRLYCAGGIYFLVPYPE
jgi:hypothetical protein